MLPAMFASRSRRSPAFLRPLLIAVPALALVALWGCDNSPDPAEPNFGAIEITTLTEGDGPAPAGYTVLFNGGVSGTVGANDVYTIPSLPPGSYVIALKEEPDRCFFGANAREITVEANETSQITYLVRCDPPADGEHQTR